MQFLYCGHISHWKHIPLSLFRLVIVHSVKLLYAYRLKRVHDWMNVYMLACVQYAWNKNDVYKRNVLLTQRQTQTTKFYGYNNGELVCLLAMARLARHRLHLQPIILFYLAYYTHRAICLWLTGLTSIVLLSLLFFSFRSLWFKTTKFSLFFRLVF